MLVGSWGETWTSGCATNNSKVFVSPYTSADVSCLACQRRRVVTVRRLVPRFVHSKNQQRRSWAATQATVEREHAPEPGSLFVFGLGYTALGLGNLLAAKGWKVSGTCRGAEKQLALQEQGFDVFLFDTDHLSLGLGKRGLAVLRAATHILVTISPSSTEDPCPVMYILGREIKEIAENAQWVGYLSSTAVYGDHDGAWVTEESETRAEAGNGLARRQMETAWLRFRAATGLPIHIFRLAGIYGPGRSALEAAQQRRDSKRAGKQFTSRCHVFDICQVLMASMHAPQPGAIYNVADDDPASREEVLDFVRQQIFHSQQSHCGQDSMPAKNSRQKEEKRVSNAKVKDELGIELVFPSFKEGLTAIHQGNAAPFQ